MGGMVDIPALFRQEELVTEDGNQPPNGEASTMPVDPREVVRLLRKEKWMILGVVSICVIGTVLWTLRQPPVYEARATLEYDPNPAQPLQGDIQAPGDPIGSYWMTKEFYETQNHIITSRVVAERVVLELGLHHDADFLGIAEDQRQGFEGVSAERAATRLVASTHVEQEADTRIVEIRVRDGDPERAQILANALSDAYIQKTMEDRLGTTVEALEWLRTQLVDLRGELDRSELALHEFKEEHHILSVSLQDRQNIVATSIQDFNHTLTEARTRRIELNARLAQMRAAMAVEGARSEGPAIGGDELSVLRARLREQLAERDSLAVRYGQNHPSSQGINAQITTLEAQIQSEVQMQVDAAQRQVAAARSIEAGLRAALADANEDGLALNLREIEYSRLNRTRENNQKLYGVVLERTTETNLAKLLRVTHVRVLDSALRPRAKVSPRMSKNVALGVFAGLLLGIAAAFLKTRLDQTVRSAAEVEAAGLTVLGILPQVDLEDAKAMAGTYGSKRRRRVAASSNDNPDLIVHTRPMSAAAECLRSLRTNITFMSADRPTSSLVVTSPSPREGKTTVAMNLAIAMAQSGHKVLLVDTDLRRPRIHRSLDVSGAVGITSVLVGERTLSEAAYETQVPGLDFLACGPIPPNPAELVQSAKFSEFVAVAREQYDRLIFDSPPLGAVTDAAILARQLDGVVMVLRQGQTTRDSLRSALRQLRDVGARVVGGVINDINLRDQQYGSGYYYNYHQYYSAADQEMDEAAE